MKPLDELNHYEALEVPPSASSEQVERAYRVACATYADDSLALYSLLDGADAEGIRERLASAYRVLADPASRRAYDADLTESQPESVLRATSAPAAEVSRPAPDTDRPQHSPQEEPHSPQNEQQGRLEDFEAEDADTNFDGAALRRARLRRGIEIEQIASETKINPSYLRFIEEESFSDLPAPVYVRGFVMAFAQTLKLDAEQVAGCYMARLAEAAQAKRPGRRLRR